MDRRSPPQKRIDDHAFPVRVNVLVPERGFENLLLDMHRWLDAEVGRGSYAAHGAGQGLTNATAWYFRTVEEAQAFVARFPMLELADGTELPTYQSPNLPFGRGAEWSDPVCNLVLDAEVAGGDAAAVRRADRPRRQHAAAARHLPRLQRADHPQRTGGPRAGHGALGHADAAAVPRRQEGRSRGDQHPADDLVALAARGSDPSIAASCPSPASPRTRRCPTARGRRPGSPSTKAGRWPSSPGIWATWTSVRKVKEGSVRADLFGFLTSAPNAEVAVIHPKAMPVILTEPAEWETWLDAPWSEAKSLAAPASGWLASHCASRREGGFRGRRSVMRPSW